jgi:hypothetical protein
MYQEQQGAAQQLPQLQAENQQLKAAVQQMQQQLESKLAETKIRAASDLKIAEMDNATKIAVARISAAKGALDEVREDQEERLATGLQMAFDAQQADADRQHEAQMADREHQQALAQAAQQHDQAMAQADQAHEHAILQGAQSGDQALEQGRQAAALQPPEPPAPMPAPPGGGEGA